MAAGMAQHAPTIELERRLRQQEAIAGFGLFALRGHAMQPVLDEACRVAAAGLGSRFAKVLAYDAARHDFLIRAGVGWRPGVVGRARLGADLASPAGYAFRTGKPVVSNHLSAEDRFRTPAVMAEHGIERAINVLIGGAEAAFGVLEVDSGDPADFSERDTAFLQSLANVVAASLAREAEHGALARSEALARRVFESSPDCLKVLDRDGTLRRMNGNGVCLLELENFAEVDGRPWESLWPEQERGAVRAAVRAAQAGGVGSFEAACPTARGATKWWEVTVAPVLDEHGRVEKLVSLSRDVTERILAARAKDALLREKDLLMQEVHHRVRNSLQLVQSLLQLQQAKLHDPEARAALAAAAQRVLTIADVHRQLYVGESVHEADLAAYLSGLAASLRASLVDAAGGRDLALETSPALLASADLAALGLIVTELVTNALKYGRGRVRICAHAAGGMVRIAVEDEGEGFAADFDPGHGSGLGMRLVTMLARGRDAIHVDRAARGGRIVVNLPLSEDFAPGRDSAA